MDFRNQGAGRERDSHDGDQLSDGTKASGLVATSAGECGRQGHVGRPCGFISCAPLGLGCLRRVPTAYAVGFILAPLRLKAAMQPGWKTLGSFVGEHGSPVTVTGGGAGADNA